MFAWYDFWIGLFYDTKKKRLYVFPIPCFGFYIDFEKNIIHKRVSEEPYRCPVCTEIYFQCTCNK